MKTLLILLFTVFIAACSTKTVVTVKESTLVEIPVEFLVPCAVVEKPISPMAFKALTLDEKSLVMYNISDSLIDALMICSSQINSIKDWQIKQKEIINKKE